MFAIIHTIYIGDLTKMSVSTALLPLGARHAVVRPIGTQHAAVLPPQHPPHRQSRAQVSRGSRGQVLAGDHLAAGRCCQVTIGFVIVCGCGSFW